MSNFLFDLGLELVRGALELVERLAYLAGNLRQLLGPKDDEGQKEKEDRLGKTHAPSYCRSSKSGNCRQDIALTTFRRGSAQLWFSVRRQKRSSLTRGSGQTEIASTSLRTGSSAREATRGLSG